MLSDPEPHEPTVVTEEIRDRALAMLREMGLGPESAMPLGAEIRASEHHRCRHCNSLYAEEV